MHRARGRRPLGSLRVHPGAAVPYLLSFLLLSLAFALSPSGVRADAQVSIRNTFELGLRDRGTKNEVAWGAGFRGDAMFGAAKPKSFRIGPAFELRTMEFRSAEAALGAGILIPMPGDCPIGVSGAIGHAIRKGDRPDGLIGIGTATWGFRGYNYHSWYGYGLNLFFSGRKHLGDETLIEFTGGLEIDVAFTTIIPARGILTFIKGGDPYED